MKYLLISIVAFFSWASLYGDSYERLYADRDRSPRVEILHDHENGQLRLKLRSRGLFSRVRTADFPLNTWRDQEQSIGQIITQIEEAGYSTELQNEVRQRLSLLSYRGQPECRVVHVDLIDPIIAEGGLGAILEIIGENARHLRLPSSIRESIYLSEVQVDDGRQWYRLYVNIDDQGTPQSVSLSTDTGDFLDFSLRRERNFVHLVSPQGRRLLTLETKIDNIRDNFLSIEVLTPRYTGSSLQNQTRERVSLIRSEGHWVTAQSPEEEKDMTYLWSNELDELQASFGPEVLLFEREFIDCMNYKMSQSLSQSGTGLHRNCRSLIEAEIRVRNYLEGAELGDDRAAQNELRQCFYGRNQMQRVGIGDDTHYDWAHPIALNEINSCLAEFDHGQQIEQRIEQIKERSEVLALAGFGLRFENIDMGLLREIPCQDSRSRECHERIDEQVYFAALNQVIDNFRGNGDECSQSLDCLRTLWIESLEHSSCLEGRIPSRLATPQELLRSSLTAREQCQVLAEREIKISELLESLESELSAFFPHPEQSDFATNHLRTFLGERLEGLDQSQFEHEKDYLVREAKGVIASLYYDLLTNSAFPSHGQYQVPTVDLVISSENLENTPLEGRRRFNQAIAVELGGWASEFDSEQGRAVFFANYLDRRLPGSTPRAHAERLRFLLNRHALKAHGELTLDLLNLAGEEHERELDSLGRRVDDCLEREQMVNTCLQEQRSQFLTLWHKAELERLVESGYLSEASGKIQALSPLADLAQCLDRYHSSEGSAESWHNLCATLSWSDVLTRSFHLSLNQHQPFLSDVGARAHRDQYLQCVSRASYNLSTAGHEALLGFLSEGEESQLTAFFVNSVDPRSTHYSERRERALLISRELMANEIDFFEIRSQLVQCAQESRDRLSRLIRDRLVEVRPEVWGDLDHLPQEEFQRVLGTLVDHELIELILEMRQRHDEHRFSLFTSLLDVPMTPELTMDSIAQSTRMISIALARGFVFDQQRLFNEAVIFREELKEALRWINQEETTLRLRELEAFFSSSQLADLLATAELSEQVHLSLKSTIDRMEQTEKMDFAQRTRNRAHHRLSRAERDEWDGIESRYNQLREIVRVMTTSYDFRRIIHQGNQQGRQLLELVKENVLLPRLLGQEPSAQAMELIQQQLAELIIADRTPGGFGERFVSVFAQAQLDEDKASRWGITLYLFHNDSDFEWESLRETEAGQQAINYYLRQILLPQMMGRRLTRYEENLRFREFQRYVGRAQSQN